MREGAGNGIKELFIAEKKRYSAFSRICFQFIIHGNVRHWHCEIYKFMVNNSCVSFTQFSQFPLTRQLLFGAFSLGILEVTGFHSDKSDRKISAGSFPMECIYARTKQAISTVVECDWGKEPFPRISSAHLLSRTKRSAIEG